MSDVRWRDAVLEQPTQANFEVFIWSPPWDESVIAEPYFDADGKFVGFCHEAVGAINARYWMPVTYPEPPEL